MHCTVMHCYSCSTYIGPRLRFPICFVFQNVTFPHISYTYLAEDRATFHANEGKVYKILPYPTDFLHACRKFKRFYLVSGFWILSSKVTNVIIIQMNIHNIMNFHWQYHENVIIYMHACPHDHFCDNTGLAPLNHTRCSIAMRNYDITV